VVRLPDFGVAQELDYPELQRRLGSFFFVVSDDVGAGVVGVGDNE